MIALASCGVNWIVVMSGYVNPTSEAFATVSVIEAAVLAISLAGLILLPVIKWLSEKFTTNAPTNKDEEGQ